MSERPSLPPAERPRSTVRTFTPRFRLSPLTQERMDTLMPRYEVPAGPIDPVAVFGRSAPLVVEIGCGHGAAAIGYALAHPEHDIVAIDVHVPGIARMMAAAQERGVPGNLRVRRGDGIEVLEDDVAPSSLAAIHLFFPDPWPKKRHAQRRFVQQRTLDLVASRLGEQGVLRIATDHAVYAEHAREQLAAHGGFDVIEGVRPDWRPTDGFEQKGIDAGRTIVDLEARVRRDRRLAHRSG